MRRHSALTQQLPRRAPPSINAEVVFGRPIRFPCPAVHVRVVQALLELANTVLGPARWLQYQPRSTMWNGVIQHR